MIHPRLCNAKPNFYPRSPCGERQANAVDQILPGHISIHALLAESDRNAHPGTRQPYAISIHALLAESDTTAFSMYGALPAISIHALLAESDRTLECTYNAHVHFYPRSPCGERPIRL